MLLPGFFKQRQARRFSFTPYYFEIKENEDEEDGARIKFRRVRRSKPPVRKSIRGLAVLALLILFGLFYFTRMVDREPRHFEIEDIRIEETPN